MTGVDDDALAGWVRAVLPDGVWSRATVGDVARELSSVLTHDQPGWRARLDALAARMSPEQLPSHLDDPEAHWFASLVGQIGVALPGSWESLGWAPSVELMPMGSDLPEEVTACVVDRRALTARYDAIVIGSGAGGGVAAQELTQAGRSVLVVERGGMPSTPDLAGDLLRSARPDAGLGALAGLPIQKSPHGLDWNVDPTAARWSIGTFGLGGGTRVSGAQAWRYAPQDFALASTYGVPEGSSLADWPVTYADLEPYYAHAEFEWGVAGAEGRGVHEGHRSGPYPLPPMPRTRPSGVLRAGAERLGWSSQCVPLLVNSEPYRGRPACVRCAQCVGFACPIGAKAGSQNTALWRAARTSRMTIILDARVTELMAEASGCVTGALIRGVDADGPWERRIDADEIVLAAGAVETARLLLSTRTARDPDGLGNQHDQVGRHLQGTRGAEALGVFDEAINDGLGPGPAIATLEFRHGNDGLVGGAVLANEYVPTPASALAALQEAGFVPLTGDEVLPTLARLLPRVQRIAGVGNTVPMADARVTLDASRTDAWGVPVARVTRAAHSEDNRLREHLIDRSVEWLDAAGATRVARRVGRALERRQAGTARMGHDPATSVCDPLGRIWGHPNVRVVDASAHVTSGGVDPALTTVANAYRVMDHLDDGERASF